MNKARYHIPETWLVKTTENALVVSGGADTSYELDITDNPDTEFARIQNSAYIPGDLSKEDQLIHEQLLAGGIAVPVVPKEATLKVRFFGETPKHGPFKDAKVVQTDTYDLGIIVHTSGTFAELLQQVDYQQIRRPHILFDATNYQNISVGPLVFPGETACLACLQGRLEYRWGDQPRPSKPRAGAQKKLIEALIDREIDRFIEQDFSMIGKTVALNFDTYSTVTHPLYKLDKCPVCSKPEIDRLTVIA